MAENPWLDHWCRISSSTQLLKICRLPVTTSKLRTHHKAIDFTNIVSDVSKNDNFSVTALSDYDSGIEFWVKYKFLYSPDVDVAVDALDIIGVSGLQDVLHISCPLMVSIVQRSAGPRVTVIDTGVIVPLGWKQQS